MDFQSPTPSSTSTQTPNPSDPIHSWWDQISKARTTIQTLSTLLPTTQSQPLLHLADTDRPAFSLLNSHSTYTSLSTTLTSPSSGTSNDPLCNFLYDTFLSSNHPDLRLFVLSYIPVLTHTYLTRTHYPDLGSGVSLSGFEAVLLAIYSSETKNRNGRPVLVQIPDLSQPSLYHSPRKQSVVTRDGLVGVLSPVLEPQSAIKSTKRACIVGVAFDCYYKFISQMPVWSKVDFCRFVTRWAGNDCPCTNEFDEDLTVENVVDGVRELEIGEREERIPLGWEMLQPVLRILGHCLLGAMNGEEVKEEAGVAVRRLYARASHDLVPQAILGTRSLVRLDRRARESRKSGGGGGGEENGTGSNVNTPNKAKKPEILLVSK